MDNYTYRRSQERLARKSEGFITVGGVHGRSSGKGDGSGSGVGHGKGIVYFTRQRWGHGIVAAREAGATPGLTDGRGKSVGYHARYLPFTPTEITIVMAHN